MPRPVGGVEAFGDDSLETRVAACGERVRSSARQRRRHLPGGAGRVQADQLAAPVPIVRSHQRFAVQAQQIEDHIHGRSAFRRERHLLTVGEMHARLQALEAGSAVGVERHDLAIDHGVSRPQLVLQAGQLRKPPVMSRSVRVCSQRAPGSQ